MIFNHPHIHRIRTISKTAPRHKIAKTLILETDLILPGVGHACNDNRLGELLEYLAIAKEKSPAFFGQFEAIEIRGKGSDEENDMDEFMPAATHRKAANSSPMEAR